MRKDIRVEDDVVHPIASTDERGFLTIANVANLVDFVVPPLPQGIPRGRPGAPPQQPSVREQAKKKIVLGPISRPPLPKSITVIGDEPFSAEGDALALDLGAAFAHGNLTVAAQQAIRQAMLNVGAVRPVCINAVLPPAHEIDLTLLTQHLLREGALMGQDLQLFLSGGALEK